MALSRSVDYLLSLVREPTADYASRAPADLHTTRRLLANLGHPERQFPVFHVTGSKGKGSAIFYLDHISRAHGLRTGVFTSPHLIDWNERIAINGVQVDDATLERGLAAYRQGIEALHSTERAIEPTFFQALTVAALWTFAEHDVDLALVEVGVGGRFDATNAVIGQVAVITSVELEHVDKLGETLERVAWHKAGIIKSGALVVCGRLPSPARDVVEATSAACGARVLHLGEDFDISLEASQGRTTALYRLICADRAPVALRFEAPSPAPIVADNAAIAITAAVCSGLMPDRDIRRVLELAVSRRAPPGRLQLVRGAPEIVIDGAHTAAALAALDAFVASRPTSRLVLVLSSSRALLPDALAGLVTRAAAVIATQAEAFRSLGAERLADTLRARWPLASIHHEPSMSTALRSATERAGPDGTICVTGSVYAAGAALEVLRNAGRLGTT